MLFVLRPLRDFVVRKLSKRVVFVTDKTQKIGHKPKVVYDQPFGLPVSIASW